MNRTLVILMLAIGFPMLMLAQAPVMQRFANGQTVGASVFEVTSTKRITLHIEDSMPLNAGYVYEFGAVKVYRNLNGQRLFVRQLRASEVMTSPNLSFAFGPQNNPDLLGDIEFEIEWVKRYNPDNSVVTLPFTPADLNLHFDVHL